MATFSVERLSFQHLDSLPNAWQPVDYLALLTKLDYDSPEAIAPAELPEMAKMALTDLEPAAAAEVVLGHLVGDELTPGQLDQLAHQLPAEKLWEENPRLDLHPQFFSATQLLYDAFNGQFPHPQAVDFQVKITAADPADLAAFAPEPAVPLVRVLAAGLPERALLHRLFGEQLAGGEFAEAPAILWQARQVEQTANSLTFGVISSSYWLEDFKFADTYAATLPEA